MSTALQAIETEQELFDRVVHHLRVLHHGAVIGHAIEVGAYLVREFFGGDYRVLHDRSPVKVLSFERFTVERKDELADLGLTAATLRNYAKAAEVAQDLPAHVLQRLCLTQLKQLTVVRDAGKRNELAKESAEMQWTGKQLGVAIRDFRTAQRHGRRKPGPRPKPAVLGATAAAHNALKRLHKLKGTLQHLDAAARRAWLAEVAAMERLLGETKAAG